jgi:transcription elongation factor Elf1
MQNFTQVSQQVTVTQKKWQCNKCGAKGNVQTTMGNPRTMVCVVCGATEAVPVGTLV